MHEPVLLEEVLSFLKIKDGGVYADCTLGAGGHSEGILRASAAARVIGVDCDESAVAESRVRLERFGERFEGVHGNFADLDIILDELGISSVEGVLLDLGLSSNQLSGAGRGFSFMTDGPLDMRFDTSRGITAEEVVNGFTEKELARIFREFGEEPAARRIAGAIVEERRKAPILTTGRLADAVGKVRRRTGRLHPATRTFQALRIAVNNELEVLEKFIGKVFRLVSPGGRVCVISYHSLEDRIVKTGFRHLQSDREEFSVNLETRTPVTPSAEEIRRNRRSRSAKLRVAERAG